MFAPSIKRTLLNQSFSDKLAIARQFYPSKKEEIAVPGFTNDPMGELPFGEKSSSFVHKYPEKILILVTNHCPVLCRFCTRKRLTFQNRIFMPEKFSDAVSHIKENRQIHEVIFSGGDPFMVSDRELSLLLEPFLELENLEKFRFHSRSLTMNPARFHPGFFKVLEVFNKQKKKCSVVMHINHSAEISKETENVISLFKKAGIPLLAQTVLLRRINDQPDILKQLIRKLVSLGIQPYYLHQLDRVSGSAHFEVNISNGLKLIEDLKKNFPLCTVPRYMLDGINGKKEISPEMI